MSIAKLDRADFRYSHNAERSIVVTRETSTWLMSGLQRRPAREIAQRFADGHQAFVARVCGVPAAWGWMATRCAAIGEVQIRFELPARHFYLWNFVTLPEFRGRGIYPRLLQEILRTKQAEWDVCWIAYAPENAASASGIHRAGFETVAIMSLNDSQHAVLSAIEPAGAQQAARVFGIPVSEDRVAQCWRCGKARPAAATCSTAACCCDYQRPQIAC
jgi:ribosomal protein S18 acetylase RimI-like enzyme